MLQTTNNLIVGLMDPVLGWLLRLPTDLALVIVAVLTSGLMVLVRRLTSNQDWLRRAAADMKQLRRLVKEASARGDRETASRLKSVATAIKVRSMKYELLPLACSIVPVLLVATWCFDRLGYVPLEAGEAFEVRAAVSRAAIGRPIHLVADEGIEAEDGWVRLVTEDSPPEDQSFWAAASSAIGRWLGTVPPHEGVAVWRLRADGRQERYVLRLRLAGRTYEHEVLVGSRRYAPPEQTCPGGPVQSVQVALRPVKFLGLVGGLEPLYLPPWLIAYLVMSICFVSALKRLFGVA